MFRRFDNRCGHYLLLLTAAALLLFPNLGGPSLWDIDEGNNAEAAREMLVSGNWVVPTFNYQLRVDKPALLYWCQIAAFRLFGVGEFAARLPSALAAIATVLLTYELGRSMFGASVGLLAGLVLASAGLFCAAGHFANPDALLIASSALTFHFFWRGFLARDRWWFAWAGLSTGLAFLAKGPVGLLLPAAAILVFLLWTREVRRLLDWRLMLGALAFAGVALPWFALVGAETRGEFLRGFFLTHNKDRFLAAMEGHRGPIYYHFISLLIGFAPWSAFLAPVTFSAIRHAAQHSALSTQHSALTKSAYRFLCCWAIVYFAFFSCSATKLPGYVLPLYPALALLTARYLENWRRDALGYWVMHGSLACLLLIGVATALGMLIAGGAVGLPLLRGGPMPGLQAQAVLGLTPAIGAVAGWWFLRREQPTGVLASVTLSAAVFIGVLAAWGSLALDEHKAPRSLVRALLPTTAEQEIRVGCYDYFQPSLVFYCRREVVRFGDEDQTIEFLQSPWPVYLFIPREEWRRLESKVATPHRLLGGHWDLYRRCEVLVVTNR